MTHLNMNETKNPSQSEINEDEIFKSLAHKLRRKIIKEIGNSKKLLFSEIRKRLKPIDSPTLSYHLKSLETLLIIKNKR